MKSLSLSKPHMILMVGVPGSGKTFFADKFAETFRAPYACQEKISSHLTDNSKAVEPILLYQISELLKTNQSIIVEGMADTRTQRLELARKARASGYEPLIVWVQTDPATARSRFMKESKTKSETISPEEYERLVKRFTPPSPAEKYIVISGKHTYAAQAKVVLKRLSEPRAAISSHSKPPVRTEPTSRRNITIR